MKRYLKLLLIINICALVSCEKDDEVLVQGVAIDLGLSVKWASCNVGADSPEDYGDYFAWGEITPKTTTYTSSDYSYSANPIVLPSHADAATVNWGGSWRMPTDAEMTELREQCTWKWTNQNGVKGYKVTSKKSGYTNNSIFLPAAGYRDGSSLNYAGSRGYYWSSSLYTGYPYAWGVFFFSGYVGRYGNNRNCGFMVRPVCP